MVDYRGSTYAAMASKYKAIQATQLPKTYKKTSTGYSITQEAPVTQKTQYEAIQATQQPKTQYNNFQYGYTKFNKETGKYEPETLMPTFTPDLSYTPAQQSTSRPEQRYSSEGNRIDTFGGYATFGYNAGTPDAPIGFTGRAPVEEPLYSSADKDLAANRVTSFSKSKFAKPAVTALETRQTVNKEGTKIINQALATPVGKVSAGMGTAAIDFFSEKSGKVSQKFGGVKDFFVNNAPNKLVEKKVVRSMNSKLNTQKYDTSTRQDVYNRLINFREQPLAKPASKASKTVAFSAAALSYVPAALQSEFEFANKKPRTYITVTGLSLGTGSFVRGGVNILGKNMFRRTLIKTGSIELASRKALLPEKVLNTALFSLGGYTLLGKKPSELGGSIAPSIAFGAGYAGERLPSLTNVKYSFAGRTNAATTGPVELTSFTDKRLSTGIRAIYKSQLKTEGVVTGEIYGQKFSGVVNVKEVTKLQGKGFTDLIGNVETKFISKITRVNVGENKGYISVKPFTVAKGKSTSVRFFDLESKKFLEVPAKKAIQNLRTGNFVYGEIDNVINIASASKVKRYTVGKPYFDIKTIKTSQRLGEIYTTKSLVFRKGKLVDIQQSAIQRRASGVTFERFIEVKQFELSDVENNLFVIGEKTIKQESVRSKGLADIFGKQLSERSIGSLSPYMKNIEEIGRRSGLLKVERGAKESLSSKKGIAKRLYSVSKKSVLNKKGSFNIPSSERQLQVYKSQLVRPKTVQQTRSTDIVKSRLLRLSKGQRVVNLPKVNVKPLAIINARGLSDIKTITNSKPVSANMVRPSIDIKPISLIKQFNIPKAIVTPKNIFRTEQVQRADTRTINVYEFSFARGIAGTAISALPTPPPTFITGGGAFGGLPRVSGFNYRLGGKPQKTRYSPSLLAVAFGIKSKNKGITTALLSGLEIRPIITKSKKRRRR